MEDHNERHDESDDMNEASSYSRRKGKEGETKVSSLVTSSFSFSLPFCFLCECIGACTYQVGR